MSSYIWTMFCLWDVLIKCCVLSTLIWLCIQISLGDKEILIQCGRSLHSESSSALFWAKPTGLFVEAGPRFCGGERKSQGGGFLQGIVSVWVSYLQGAAVPHSLFFAPMCDTEARLTTPLFPSLRFFSAHLFQIVCARVCPHARAVHTRFGCLFRQWQMACSPRPDYQTHIIEIRALHIVKLSLPFCSQLSQCPRPTSIPLFGRFVS